MSENEIQIEYRVCWSASSNINFKGTGDWQQANPGETAEEVEDHFGGGSGSISDGLELALGESGFEWWVETREVEAENE